MQIKKREIKARLMQSAKDEFLKKGFEKASIREIVKNAGTTIGNFYNYFEGKEDIFSAIVKKTYNQIARFVKSHSAKDEDPYVLDSFDTSQARKFVSGALALLSDNFFENLILLTECSEGTRYQNTRSKIVDFIGRHFIEHRDLMNSTYIDNGMSRLLAEQFVAGVLFVLKKDSTIAHKSELITDYLLFYIYGMLGLLTNASSLSSDEEIS
jgi:AcrR family transcriptional regulator